MAKGIHKGSELRNVSETWEENERNRESGAPGAPADDAIGPAGETSELEKVIHEEAVAYDRSNKEARILGGERATVNDDEGQQAP